MESCILGEDILIMKSIVFAWEDYQTFWSPGTLQEYHILIICEKNLDLLKENQQNNRILGQEEYKMRLYFHNFYD